MVFLRSIIVIFKGVIVRVDIGKLWIWYLIMYFSFGWGWVLRVVNKFWILVSRFVFCSGIGEEIWKLFYIYYSVE